MADNSTIPVASGNEVFANDDIGPGVKYPRVKIVWGVDGVATDASGSNPLPITGTVTANAGTGTMTVGGTVNVNGVATTAYDRGAGAATSQTTRVTIDSLQLGALGQAAMAASAPVTLPSDSTGSYSSSSNFVSGATAAMTGTTSTAVIAPPASGLRNYITQITVSNSHATVGTDVIIQDGSGGTTLYTIPAAANYGGAVITFPTPLRQPTTATGLYCANVTTGSSTKVSASGFKGA